MKKFKEFIIRTTPFSPDLLSGLLWELNISGLIEENDFIKIFAENNFLSKKEIKNFLERLINESLIENFSIEEFQLQNKNWNEEWEKNLNIIKAGERIVIKPSFKKYSPKEDELVITIDPKMSFGTGEHQTTKLMLRLVEKYVKPGIKVLDVGSGTAVLAIASIKLGAANAVALDNDELCFENGIENSKINNVDDKIIIRTGELNDIAEADFELILANIQKNILINIAAEIKRKLKEKGIVILSGLLAEDEQDIVECYTKAGLFLIEKEQMDEWIALVFILK